MYVKFDIKILLFMVVFYIINKVELYVIIMISVVLHELFHLLVGILVGAEPITMEIKFVGCAVSFKYKMNDYLHKIHNGNIAELKKIAIYIAGPLLNVFIAIIALFLSKNSCFLGHKIIEDTIYANLALAIFNCIPIYPLDGGRILKSISHIFCGEEKAYIIAQKISKAFVIIMLISCSFLILKFHSWGIIFAVLYVAYLNAVCSKKIKTKVKIIKMIKK